MPATPMPDLDTTIAGLRAWIDGSSPDKVAAVEMLIWQESWLRRRDFFTAACTASGDGDEGYMVSINWGKARQFVAANPARASSSELAWLDLAVALGSNQYRLRNFGLVHRAELVKFLTAALA